MLRIYLLQNHTVYLYNLIHHHCKQDEQKKTVYPSPNCWTRKNQMHEQQSLTNQSKN